MMRLSLLLAALFICISAAASDIDLFGAPEDPPFFAVEPATHYGNPKDGCMDDEKMFRIRGIDGYSCFPQCSDTGKCPSDVPADVTAQPMCALSTPTGTDYCVLICDPGSNREPCGKARCRSIAGKSMGLCTYDMRSQDEEDEFVGAW